MINVFRLLNLFRDKIIFIIALITSLAFLELLTFSFLKPIIAYFSNANYLNDDYFFSVYKNFDFKNLILIFIIIFFIRCCLSIYVSYKRSSLVKYINDYLSEKIYNIYLYKDHCKKSTLVRLYLLPSNTIKSIWKHIYGNWIKK